AVRVEYPREPLPGVTVYETAASTLREWVGSGVLRRDETPALYLVRHRFTQAGTRFERLELLAALRLQPWSDGAVLPHEHTREGPKQDRLELMRACKSNLSPIMGLYDDFRGIIAALLERVIRVGNPGTTATATDGDGYEVWAVDGADDVRAICDAVAHSGPVYIADGHHRYETALVYRDEVLGNPGETHGNAAQYVMTSLIALQDEGLLSLPYHRLLKGMSADQWSRFQRQADVYFNVESIDVTALDPVAIAEAFAASALAGGGPLIGLFGAADQSSMRLLRPRSPETLDGLMLGRSAAWRSLSPCLFVDVLLQPSLGFGQQPAESAGYLGYPVNAAGAVSAVRSGDWDVAVLLDGVPLDRMTEVARDGERLPPKSTFFHPKLATGLVFNPLEGSL
ncbi:MAG: DUF1015 domain-containing protein, partial [Chloroflexi bacterium]|nr:DUF1015 domain-containing protein [Chloroflexota bacterium]